MSGRIDYDKIHREKSIISKNNGFSISSLEYSFSVV